MTDDEAPRQPAGQDVVVQRLVGFRALLLHDETGAPYLTSADDHPLPTLAPGERIRVLTTVPGDATYATAGRVVATTVPSEEEPQEGDVDPQGPAAPTITIQLEQEQAREQQRRHVRVPTPEIDVQLIGLDEDLRGLGDLLNVSAGGIRTATDNRDLPIGGQIQVVFALPMRGRKDVDVNLTGEIVWSGKGPQGRAALGIRFLDADDATQAKLTSWVFKQETTGTV